MSIIPKPHLRVAERAKSGVVLSPLSVTRSRIWKALYFPIGDTIVKQPRSRRRDTEQGQKPAQSMGSQAPPSVAIIGGGLCGLSLAIALKKRSISFKIYEARASFTEIGAGINLGPNTAQTFRLIDESLAEAIERLVTRNPPSKEEVWMQVRFGAASGRFKDGGLITNIMAPPTGNRTVKRNDLLDLLASKTGPENAAFNKKLVGLDQDDSGVTLSFTDGTREYAGAAIACDGIHSATRRIMFGSESQAAIPRFSQAGAYRGILSKEKLASLVGDDIAGTSTIFLGPGAYVIMYPVEGHQSVNCGLWPWRRCTWTEREWLIPHQKQGMEDTFSAWGETVHKIMALMEDPSFFATFYHGEQPKSFHVGRVLLIGDAAHSMPPHQGAGAGQALEDAYVLAEVLGHKTSSLPSQQEIEASFEGYEAVRKPRAQRALETSVEAMSFWSDWHRPDLTEVDVANFVEAARDRFDWLWYDDIADQGRRAKVEMARVLAGGKDA
ncbi:hypothetical protein LTR12_017024 [Friedmanniomyces endolithicus]|nr:hypothetical protein LTR12_017024 [Friedmanniomyces endolithicus]